MAATPSRPSTWCCGRPRASQSCTAWGCGHRSSRAGRPSRWRG
jgi:hypothetical protein